MNDAEPSMLPDSEYDVVIIGGVSALKLTEKGYRVAFLEAGRRFRDDDFPENSWHLRSFLFAPRLRCFGIFRMSLARNAFILPGAGVVGGSPVYAQTLYVPGEAFYKGKQWDISRIGRRNWHRSTTRRGVCSALPTRECRLMLPAGPHRPLVSKSCLRLAPRILA